jgi:mono/diheme cytochrome c family protein
MRWLLALALVILLLAAGAAIYLAAMEPAQRPASAESIEATPERLARGEYLAEAVLNCFDCHSEREKHRFGMPIVAHKKGAGDSFCPDHTLGFPGRVCIPNITPDPAAGISSWSDGEILRAIREGVRRDGTAIFPLMPYSFYRSLSDEDAGAVVVYLRSIKPIARERNKTELDFPVNWMVKFEPKPLAGPVPPPGAKDYGKYLAEVAGCRGCHTPVDAERRMIAGKDFSGGQIFPIDTGVAIRSSNITPHATGLGALTKEAFIAKFKVFAEREPIEVPPDQNTVMPWFGYARMTEEDLGAIYDYLKTVPPIENRVPRLRSPFKSNAKNGPSPG